MGVDLRGYDAGVRRYTEQTVPNKVRDLRDAAAFEAVATVVRMTIVDTGRAKGNWQVTAGQPAEGHTEDTDKSGAATLGAAQAAVSAARNPWTPIWLHNGLPYIKNMDLGLKNFSRTGALHMVDAAVARVRRMFR